LGLNSADQDVEQTEASLIVTMLNGAISQETIFQPSIQEERIVKSGWLRNNDGQNYWCFIENGCFNAVAEKTPEQSLKFKLDEISSSRDVRRQDVFFIANKADLSKRHSFIAEAPHGCEEWLSALSTREHVGSAVADASGGPSISMDNFEIHKVLGRGKFGKVRLRAESH
jgi:hypothetical protein